MRRRCVLALAPVLAVLAACLGACATTPPASAPAAQTATTFPSTPSTPPAPPTPQTAASGTETRNVSGFNAIELNGVGNATIEQTGAESLTVEAEPIVLPLLTSDVSGGTLRLGVRPNTSISTTRPINYRITVKELRGLSVSGSGEISASRITTDKLTVTIRGAGEIKIDGSADTQELQISGSGDYQASGLTSRTASATITGSGDADIAVSEALTVTIRGSGKLTYSGNPTVTQRITGAGDVVHK